MCDNLKKIHEEYTKEPCHKASASKKNPPITIWIFSPVVLFLLILYIGNKASLAIRHEINWSLEMRYCGVPLYVNHVPLTAESFHCDSKR